MSTKCDRYVLLTTRDEIFLADFSHLDSEKLLDSFMWLNSFSCKMDVVLFSFLLILSLWCKIILCAFEQYLNGWKRAEMDLLWHLNLLVTKTWCELNYLLCLTQCIFLHSYQRNPGLEVTYLEISRSHGSFDMRAEWAFIS